MRVLMLTILLMATPVIVYAWPWEIDVNNLVVKELWMERPKQFKPDLSSPLSASEQLMGGRINLIAHDEFTDVFIRVQNNTKVYINAVRAACIVFNKQQNRLFKGEVRLYTGAEIAPNGGTGVLSGIIEKLHRDDADSMQCQLISAEGAK
jgi:hypothetical protein